MGTMKNLFNNEEVRSIIYSPSILSPLTKLLQEESETSNMLTAATSVLSNICKEREIRLQIYSDTLLSSLIRLASSNKVMDDVKRFANTTIALWESDLSLRENFIFVLTKILQEESEASNMITTTTSLLSKVYKEEKFRSQIYSDTLLLALVRLAKSKVAADAARQFANRTIVFWAQEENLLGKLVNGSAVDVVETFATKGRLI